MRRWLALFAFVLLLLTAPVRAVGTVTVVNVGVGGGVTKYTISWTSTAGGAVSANLFTVRAGRLIQVRFVPGTAGTQPSDLYDVTLVNTDSIDLLAGGGANLSNAAATIQQWDPPLYQDGTQQLDLVVAAAGNAKTGQVILLVQ